MEKQEFGKVIKNHYVVPRIKIELTNAVIEAEKTQELSKTEAFLRYFTKEAYFDDLVFIRRHHEYRHFLAYMKRPNTMNVTWKRFADEVQHIYEQEASRGNSSEMVMELALQGINKQEKRIEEDLKQKPDR